MTLENQFILELNELEEQARQAGYLNHKANQTQKKQDIQKYEQARTKQLDLYREFIKKYIPHMHR